MHIGSTVDSAAARPNSPSKTAGWILSGNVSEPEPWMIIAGTLRDRRIERFVAEISPDMPPQIPRASRDKPPQPGAAALALQEVMNAAVSSDKTRKCR